MIDGELLIKRFANLFEKQIQWSSFIVVGGVAFFMSYLRSFTDIHSMAWVGVTTVGVVSNIIWLFFCSHVAFKVFPKLNWVSGAVLLAACFVALRMFFVILRNAGIEPASFDSPPVFGATLFFTFFAALIAYLLATIKRLG